jgi:hypothetical protein
MEYAMWPMGLRGLGKERIQQHISLRGTKLCAKTNEPEYHHKVLGEVNVDDLLGAISDLASHTFAIRLRNWINVEDGTTQRVQIPSPQQWASSATALVPCCGNDRKVNLKNELRHLGV